MKNKLYLLFSFVSVSIWSQTSVDSIPFESRKLEENFRDNYQSDEFQYEAVIQIKELNAWDRFWAAVQRFFESLFNFGGSGETMSALEILMKIIAIIIVVIVVYLVVKVIINKEGGWIFSKSAKKIIPVENVEENIHTLNFQTIIAQAKNNKNNRLVIRYYYLWLLKSLSDKNTIEWDIEKTNSDYIREIKDNKLKQDFQFLSYIFEYSWYGEFELNETDFSKAETTFLKLISHS